MARKSLASLEQFVEGFNTHPFVIGIDVHKRSLSVALLRADGKVHTIVSPANPAVLINLITRLEIQVSLVAQEAGPTGHGTPITAWDVNANVVKLRYPSGTALIPAEAPAFHENSVLGATWNISAGEFGATEVVAWDGFTLDFSNYATLPAGDYTFEVDVGTGTPLSYTFSYPGMATAALVDIATMSLTDNPDNTATFMWTEPVGDLDE